ncbi:hypothetical protein [Paracoccus shandongensis]|uniref:hypothetical protein n=1 Tax=Paracoccus shandongensis TaxID=2816048 RepID=UPI001A8DE5C1|nr:hypothetical protein [Paracoccus shandongensis]
MLKRDFAVTGTPVERGEDESVKLSAFDLTHKTHGRLLSADGDGNVALFDRAGNAMDAAHVDALFGAAGTVRSAVVDRMM